ncbi:MAG: DUF928 domain-containing protein [Nostocaceae cyanobacterium]|nr:DUF928 domain-containing protein [Nostocaceae cyanobacterium]
MKLSKNALYRGGISISVGFGIISGLTIPVKAQSQLELKLAQQSQTFKISQAFNPPDRGRLETAAGGATRDGYVSCSQVNKVIKPLMPEQNLGLTLSDRPTFFWHKTKSSGTTAEFFLANKDREQVYQTSIKLPDKGGIFAFTLPADAPALESGKLYQWFLEVNCTSSDFNQIPVVGGWVEKIEPSVAVKKQLENADSTKQSAIYTQAGIWHESIATLAQLRCNNPNDFTVKGNWSKFLNSVGFQDLVSQPLLNSCVVEEKLPKDKPETEISQSSSVSPFSQSLSNFLREKQATQQGQQ